MIKKGQKIDTNFTLDIVRNGEKETVDFSELLDRPTIVSVYMKNNTSSCDKQTASLAEQADWFDDEGYNVVAVSKNGCRSHQNYAKKMGINYVLASDPDYKFGEATDSVVEKSMFGNTYEAPTRSAYIIDVDGKVLGIIEKVDSKNHSEELKNLIHNL